MLRPASDAHYAADRSWLSTMREREVRRVWRTVDGEGRVFEVEMASVIRTDPSGNPIIDHSHPNLGKPQPYESKESGK